MMVMVPMMVPSGGEYRACTHQEQKGGDD